MFAVCVHFQHRSERLFCCFGILFRDFILEVDDFHLEIVNWTFYWLYPLRVSQPERAGVERSSFIALLFKVNYKELSRSCIWFSERESSDWKTSSNHPTIIRARGDKKVKIIERFENSNRSERSIRCVSCQRIVNFREHFSTYYRTSSCMRWQNSNVKRNGIKFNLIWITFLFIQKLREGKWENLTHSYSIPTFAQCLIWLAKELSQGWKPSDTRSLTGCQREFLVLQNY